jgi:hypothetical protein
MYYPDLTVFPQKTGDLGGIAIDVEGAYGSSGIVDRNGFVLRSAEQLSEDLLAADL